MTPRLKEILNKEIQPAGWISLFNISFNLGVIIF